VDLTGVREPITLVTKLSQKMSNLSCFWVFLHLLAGGDKEISSIYLG
jgi:hypothetical protein